MVSQGLVQAALVASQSNGDDHLKRMGRLVEDDGLSDGGSSST